MTYYGFISEWTVNYTHFTENMVPIRCTIDVEFTMMPQPGTGGGAATWQDAQLLQGNYVAAVPYANGVVPANAGQNLPLYDLGGR